jgi:hypothetical protein
MVGCQPFNCYWPDRALHSAFGLPITLCIFLLVVILLHLPQASHGYATTSGIDVTASTFDHQHSDLQQHHQSFTSTINHLRVCRVGCAFALPSRALTEAPDHSLVIVEAGDYVEDAPPLLWAPAANVRGQNVTLVYVGRRHKIWRQI